jgi:hypothetical protein
MPPAGTSSRGGGCFRHCLFLFTESAHTDAVSDDDDRPRDASGAADAGWSDPEVNTAWADAHAPDDISELARDIQAYHRENRAAHRRESLQRLSSRRGVTPALMAVAAVVIAALIATLLTVVDPRRGPTTPTELPLAQTAIADGHVNGLLPDTSLRVPDGAAIAARTLRPAVVAVLPARCECTPLVSTIAQRATVDNVQLDLVAPTYPDAYAASLPGQLEGATSVYYDTAGQLAPAVGAVGLTLVIVARDGSIYHIQRAVTSSTVADLSPALGDMLRTGIGG